MNHTLRSSPSMILVAADLAICTLSYRALFAPNSAGISNGAMMSDRLACEQPQRFAAAARPVANDVFAFVRIFTGPSCSSWPTNPVLLGEQ